MGVFGRLFETSEGRQTRIAKGMAARKKKEKTKVEPIRVAPTKPRVGLGNTIDKIERRKRYLQDL